MSNTSADIDAYIKDFPDTVQTILNKIRETIHRAVPEAEEAISYGMPAFKYKDKPVVYFGGWREHIGFYATPSGNEAFRKELSPYQGAKGSVKFPLDQPMPYDLIEKIARYRLAEVKKLLEAK
jgi:uncharacterized protein YdhG (YjbR/CyaY superfamily)